MTPAPSKKRILVTSALPYANGPSHIGRLTGAYLPADIYVRYQRLMKRDVVYICGSDEHGVAISMKAKKEGITVKTRLDILAETPVDAMELSTVIANAIENARNACRCMPPGSTKTIELICVSKPHFVFECSNTFCGRVLFDKNGMPVSDAAGHGIGTKSINAFVKKYNAFIDYQAENGIFTLRILLAK